MQVVELLRWSRRNDPRDRACPEGGARGRPPVPAAHRVPDGHEDQRRARGDQGVVDHRRPERLHDRQPPAERPVAEAHAVLAHAQAARTGQGPPIGCCGGKLIPAPLSPRARSVRYGHDKIAARRKEPQMQYALLIYSKPEAAEALSADEREANHREYLDIKKLPGVVGGASLHPVETATTVRVQDGQTLVTDGPFADTKEVFGGFYLIEADDLDQATEIAARIPAARIGGSVEIRPVIDNG